jgi:hypothetical protein
MWKISVLVQAQGRRNFILRFLFSYLKPAFKAAPTSGVLATA